MRVVFAFGIIVLLLSSSCNNSDEEIKRLKNEIISTEAEFCKAAEDEGLQKAFLKFSDEDAVLLRNNELVKGKNSIKDFYQKYNTADSNIKLVWEPDFVEVSKSGDLAYTYGKYVFTKYDSSGVILSDTGIFHTIWKRQENGKWLFVWD